MSFVKVRYAALTDVGVKRSHNQDACTAQPAADEATYRQQGHVFVVADGMGGHAVGEKASAKAIRDIPLTYQKHVKPDAVADTIRRAFTEANADIFDIGAKNPEFRGLGTTATALFLRSDGAWIGHVGDSRAYRVRRGVIEQLTFDHSWVWEIARRQGIDPDELGDFKKNVIIRSLGPDEHVEVDIEGPHPVEAGDAYLLCSDGLSNQVTGDEMGAAVASMPPDEAARYLVELANLRGGPDNITCLIVQMPGADGSTGPAAPDIKSGAVGRALTAWGRVVPWSYTLLGFGILIVALSLVAKQLEEPGVAVGLFGLATALIVAGVITLFVQLKKGTISAPTTASDATTELHVYKAYTFDFDQQQFDKVANEDGPLRDTLMSRSGGVNWTAYQKFLDESSAKITAGELPGAYRAACLALGVLASAVNKDRGKDEGFRPNWGDGPNGKG